MVLSFLENNLKSEFSMPKDYIQKSLFQFSEKQKFGNSKCEILTAKLTLTFLRPYIVYMLQDLDILEDWTTIRKV